MEYILITGAYGGMGRATVQALRARGYGVFALDRKVEPSDDAGVIPIRADLTDAASVASAVAAVRAAFFERDTLTHRDFLGSLMGSGIKRETVGDIYVAGGSCDFLVLREILPYVLQNLTSAGRTKLSLQEISLADIQLPQQAVKTVRDTVPSLRLDGIISSGFSISRGKAADYVSAGKAELNYLPCMKGDKQVSEGDLVSVRGLGKLRLEKVGGNTKKGRISIEISRFL